MHVPLTRLFALLLASAVFATPVAEAATPAPSGAQPVAKGKAKAKKPKGKKKRKKAKVSPTRDVMLVGNNWAGTADIVDAHSFKRYERLNIVPDKDERLAEVAADPERLALFMGNTMLVGEGHNQYVDDMFTSNDGRMLFVSRPSFADVVAFDLATKKIAWRFPVEGARSDPMGISPDGKRLLVSASLARKVHVIDTATGKSAGDIESGDQPHESNFSKDGSKIFHASIGTVFTPLDDPAFDSTKGDRWFEVIDARTLKVEKRLDIGQILRTFGYPGMSSAVRPMAISPDEKTAYFQLSFFHGFVEFDLVENRPVRFAWLPVSEKAAAMRREEYLLDSAHHGLALDPTGEKLCVAGTMSDYAAIVSRRTFAHKIVARGTKPYWSTNSADGKHCYVSFSGDDTVAVLDYATEKEIARFDVGDHPQRVRTGVIRKELLPAG